MDSRESDTDHRKNFSEKVTFELGSEEPVQAPNLTEGRGILGQENSKCKGPVLREGCLTQGTE